MLRNLICFLLLTSLTASVFANNSCGIISSIDSLTNYNSTEHVDYDATQQAYFAQDNVILLKAESNQLLDDHVILAKMCALDPVKCASSFAPQAELQGLVNVLNNPANHDMLPETRSEVNYWMRLYRAFYCFAKSHP